MSPEDRTRRMDRLVLAALPHVVFDGWTQAALEAGARDAAMAAADAARYFPAGARDALAHFSSWADRRMQAGLEASDLGKLKIRERVALAVSLRLEALAPYREAVRRGLGFLALPPNSALGAQLLYRTVDAVWRGIGDRPADFSFYTKRALLGAVLSATMLYWLDDKSEGFADTRAFLDRRIADAMRIPALAARCERLAARLPDPFRILRAARAR